MSKVLGGLATFVDEDRIHQAVQLHRAPPAHRHRAATRLQGAPSAPRCACAAGEASLPGWRTEGCTSWSPSTASTAAPGGWGARTRGGTKGRGSVSDGGRGARGRQGGAAWVLEVGQARRPQANVRAPRIPRVVPGRRGGQGGLERDPFHGLVLPSHVHRQPPVNPRPEMLPALEGTERAVEVNDPRVTPGWSAWRGSARVTLEEPQVWGFRSEKLRESRARLSATFRAAGLRSSVVGLDGATVDENMSTDAVGHGQLRASAAVLVGARARAARRARRQQMEIRRARDAQKRLQQKKDEEAAQALEEAGLRLRVLLSAQRAETLAEARAVAAEARARAASQRTLAPGQLPAVASAPGIPRYRVPSAGRTQHLLDEGTARAQRAVEQARRLAGWRGRKEYPTVSSRTAGWERPWRVDPNDR